MSQGKLPLNDMAGGAGRMDVIVRALMASLMTSHGFRKDTEVILHLQGGPGPNRRIRIDGAAVKGIHAEERSVAGQIAKVLKETSPPKGRWIERSKGIWDSRGDIQDTIEDWSQATIVALDASAERLWNNDSIIPMQSNPLSNFQELGENLSVEGIDIGFILSDDKPLESDLPPSVKLRSLGDIWLQGHMAIGICHFLMDEGVSLNL
jgi:tRNA pseudouridine-54 N-methylase